MNLSGSSVLVTGGAGMLGRATARHLLGLGARVVAADSDEEGCESLQRALPDVVTVAADICNSGEVGEAIDAAVEIGPLRLVLNCAGTGFIKRIIDPGGKLHDLGSLRELLEVHVVGYFNVLRLSASTMALNEPSEAGERGVVINTSSIAGLEGSAGQAAYGTAKAAVAGMTLPAARDLGVVGVRVVAIAPNGIGEDVAENGTTRRLLAQAAFPKRFGRPLEFAMLVESVALNPYINGQVIRLDGGTRLPLK